jgi:hypothetical protein
MRHRLTGVCLLVFLLPNCKTSVEGQNKQTNGSGAVSATVPMQSKTHQLARKLIDRAYGEMFVYPSHDQTIDAIWNEPGNAQVLEALVEDTEQPLQARFLACEVLFAKDFTFTSRVPASAVAEIYARALEGNFTGMANSWGLLYEHDDPGPVGVRFIMLGDDAIPALVRLLDNDAAPLIYSGSKEATVGNAYQFRIKDFAAYYLGRILNRGVAWHESPVARDQEIDKLKKTVQKPRPG